MTGDSKKKIRDPNEGDRPPIIISDGSIDVYLEAITGGRGYWQQESDPKIFTHVPANPLPAVLSFDVYLLNANGRDCSNPDKAYSVTAFDLSFGSKDEKNIHVGISATSSTAPGNFQISFPDDPPYPDDNNVWLSLDKDKDARIKSVTLNGMKCEFAASKRHRASITVIQHDTK